MAERSNADDATIEGGAMGRDGSFNRKGDELLPGTLARRYGIAASSRLMRDLLIARALWREEDLRALCRHSRTVGLLRAHAHLIDRRAYRGLPFPGTRETVVQEYDLKTSHPGEAESAHVAASVSAKALKWTLDGLDINPRDFSFIDVGSGNGVAVLGAARRPFRKAIGVELAREVHEAALSNLAWARENWALAAAEIEFRNESALATRLPDMPCVVFLYSPFGPIVMQEFIERLIESHRECPRPIIVLYLHAVYRELFERPEFVPLPLKFTQRMLLHLVGPVTVRSYWLVGNR
jgi:hypothetical protein